MSINQQQKVRPEEQTLERSSYLGSSDIAAICGLSKWKTAYDVWEEKLGLAQFIDDPEREVRLRRGKRFEPIILDAYQEESGAWIIARNRRYIDADYDFLSCEIDAEEQDEQTGDITNLEVKSVDTFGAKEFGESGSDEVPAYYAAQIMFGLMVSERDNAKLVGLIGTDDLRVYPLKRDDEVIAYLRKKAVDFWHNHVLAEVPPPIQTKDDAAKAIRRFNGVTLAASESLKASITRLKEVRAATKLLEAEQAGLEMDLKRAMVAGCQGEPGKFAIVDDSGRPLATWNEQSATRLNVGKVKELAPEVALACTVTSSFRVLRLK